MPTYYFVYSEVGKNPSDPFKQNQVFASFGGCLREFAFFVCISWCGELCFDIGVEDSLRLRLYFRLQDNYCVFEVMVQGQKVSFYGVFDGHGSHGHDVSKIVRDRLAQDIFRDVEMFARDPKTAIHRWVVHSLCCECAM